MPKHTRKILEFRAGVNWKHATPYNTIEDAMEASKDNSSYAVWRLCYSSWHIVYEQSPHRELSVSGKRNESDIAYICTDLRYASKFDLMAMG